MTGDNSKKTPPKRIQAVENMSEIVKSLQELEQCGVRELGAHMDIPKSTAHIYLKTLEETGYVVKRDGTYRLSHRFLEIGGHIRHRSNVYQPAREMLDKLAQTTGAVATIGIEERGYRVMLYRTVPTGGVFNNAPTGEHTKMHWTAVGKALLSQKSDEDVRSIIDEHGLPKATENTITEREALFTELERIRDRGYSVEDEEHVNGVKSVAVPIENSGDSYDVAISVAGPIHELGAEHVQSELLPALQNTANVIELKMRHY